MAKAKTAGRPKLNPMQAFLRKMGKHFTAADQLLAASKTDIPRTHGRGKQPFSSITKSLQEKREMLKCYIGYLTLAADDAGYEFDNNYEITDADKEAPWQKLKRSYRKNDMELSVGHEQQERRAVFDSSQDEYSKNYPYNEWNAFWFEADISALERFIESIILTLDIVGVEYMSMNDALQSEQAQKGRETFINKQGVNKRDNFSLQHAKIVRFKGRYKNAISDIGRADSDITRRGIANEPDPDIAKKMTHALTLKEKITNMERRLKKELAQATPERQQEFEFILARKRMIALKKKMNSSGLSEKESQELVEISEVVEAKKKALKSA